MESANIRVNLYGLLGKDEFWIEVCYPPFRFDNEYNEVYRQRSFKLGIC
jgi:hypothetical protein